MVIMASLLQNKYTQGAIEYVKKAKRLGMMEYVLSDIFQKIMVFIGGFIIVRILSKEDYGKYTYLVNLFSIFYLLGDFGMSAAVLQFGSIYHDDKEKKDAYLQYTNKMLLRISLISVLIVLIGSYIYRFKIAGVNGLFRLMMLLPLLYNEIMFYQSLLRIDLRNKEYARLNLLNTAIHYTALISLSIMWGLKGAIIAFYPPNVIVLIIYIMTLRFNKHGETKYQLSREEKKHFWKFALLMQVNQTSLALLNYLDIYCLGNIVKQPEVIAEYKVASTIPTAMYFIPKTVMFFLVPFLGRKRDDTPWVKRTLKRTILGNALICGSASIVLALFSDLLIRLIFSDQYKNATSCFIVLLLGFFVYGVLQTPASNMLSIYEKLKIVLFASVGGALLNIALNIILIRLMGAIGAAFATVASHLFIGLLLTAYLWIYLKKSRPTSCTASIENQN